MSSQVLTQVSPAQPGDRLVDAFVAGYVCWREACSHVWAAADAWTAAPNTDLDLRFTAFGASLDREAAAAAGYAEAAASLRRFEATRPA